jgi:glutathionyl-hydroquinone reductase
MALPPAAVIGTGRWVWSSLWHLMMSQMAPRSSSGAYQRPDSQFRQWVSAEADSVFPPATGRYILIAGEGCPWAHRTLVVRALKGLEDVIQVVKVSPNVNAGGWKFDDSPYENCQTLPELYLQSQAGYKGRCTVPVLWDSQTRTVVNNESADIIVMLNDAFNGWAKFPDFNLYPADLREHIDGWNEKIYRTVNNGVYRCGFAQTQAAYDQSCTELFATLDELDQVLAQQRYVCGDRVTLADVRLFTTLFRFDAVYFGLFKCNVRQIQSYSSLGPYLRDLYQLPEVSETCNLAVIKQDYYGNLFPLNPGGIIPKGPDELNFSQPHGRESLSPLATR